MKNISACVPQYSEKEKLEITQRIKKDYGIGLEGFDPAILFAFDHKSFNQCTIEDKFGGLNATFEFKDKSVERVTVKKNCYGLCGIAYQIGGLVAPFEPTNNKLLYKILNSYLADDKEFERIEKNMQELDGCTADEIKSIKIKYFAYSESLKKYYNKKIMPFVQKLKSGNNSLEKMNIMLMIDGLEAEKHEIKINLIDAIKTNTVEELITKIRSKENKSIDITDKSFELSSQDRRRMGKVFCLRVAHYCKKYC